MFPAKAALVVCLCSVLAGCAPAVRLEVAIMVPAAPPLLAERLHLSGAKRCPPGPVALADPASGSSDAEYHRIEFQNDQFRTTSLFHGRQCTVRLFAWYDGNGDGTVDVGDFTGATPPIEAKDGGLFKGNVTRGSPLALEAVPSRL